MRRIDTSRIIPVVLVALIAVIAIAALVSVGRLIFSSGSSSSPQTDTSQQSLVDISAGHSVSMSVRGPIVADEDFRSYIIDVSSSSREIKTYQGYGNALVSKAAFGNSVAAYEQFVYALSRTNVAATSEYEGDRNDTRGVCATGRLYEFTILEEGKPVKQLWTTTCGSASGSLRVKESVLLSLFKNQIPDSTKIIRDVDL